MTNPSIETEIIDAEERLRLGMLRSDVDTLDELLASNLIFTNHLGQVLSKQDDLTAHRSGKLAIRELIPSEQHIQYSGEVAIVSVRMRLSGSYNGVESSGDFRFTRIWQRSSGGTWQVAAAHSSIVASV